MKLFNTTNISEVVALEKKLINFLTQEQLEEIAKYEKEILNDLVNSKNNYQALQETHRKLVEKLGSIGIDVNSILNPPQPNNEEQEDYEECEDEECEDDEDDEEDYEDEDYEEED